MTHRPETAYKSYAAKNRREEALESVSVMTNLMYGERSGGAAGEGGAQWEGSTVPSSAGALQRREPFNADQVFVLEKEARKLEGIPGFRMMTKVLQIMSRHKPLFDTHAPKTVEGKLRKLAAAQLEASSSQPKRRRQSGI